MIKTKTKNKRFTITNEDLGFLIQKKKARFRGAYLSETAGPNFRPITWVVRGGQQIPYVCESHTHVEIRKLLNPWGT
jgi:hypothetical protein